MKKQILEEQKRMTKETIKHDYIEICERAYFEHLDRILDHNPDYSMEQLNSQLLQNTFTAGFSEGTLYEQQNSMRIFSLIKENYRKKLSDLIYIYIFGFLIICLLNILLKII